MRSSNRRISEVELDLGRYELRRGGRRVKLAKKPMELLIFLVARREQMVSRQEIISKLWRSDLFIDTQTNINNIVRKIRTALGDNSSRPRFLETVVGKGYRFIGPVRVVDARFQQSNFTHALSSEAKSGHISEWGERSSLAVLPLLLLGNMPDDPGVSLGFADALVSRMGNLQGVDVLPTSSVLTIPLEAPNLEIASHLGVRFVVRGAIQESKGQWRLSLEMFDTHLQSACFARKCDFDMNRLFDIEDDTARQIAGALNRTLVLPAVKRPPRHSRDPLAYSEFMRGYRLSSSGDAGDQEEAARRLTTAVMRDPGFSLAHAMLSFVYATRHFEFDPASTWLEKAEFHCRRALELDPDLPEGHVAKAFLLWGPSKNFQHLEAIAELRRALSLQNNLPHAYNRLGTILAHIGLLDHARAMYERGRQFHPRKAVSHSIVQVYIWGGELELAREEIQGWRAENPGNKYPIYFAPQIPMMAGDWKEAKRLLDEAFQLLPGEPMILSMIGLFYALTGKSNQALDYLTRACASPKSFGHAHHTHYQVACILSVLGRPIEAFEWLERSVSAGFACWPYFMKDSSLQGLHKLPEFEVLVSSLQAKYPDHLGLF
jgi:DNA-binding winged helix-turn-helix (wHTH) protein/tetratricopeptide (TPR) repeat protein